MIRFKQAALALSFCAATFFSGPLAHGQAVYTVNSGQAAFVQDMGGDTYKSRYFGMTFQIPDGWDVSSERDTRNLLSIGEDLVAGDDNTLRADMERQNAQALPILHVVKLDNGINLSAMAERLEPGVENLSGSDYFDSMRKLGAQSATPIDFESDYSARMIGGRRFTMMNGSISLDNGLTVQQNYYALSIGNYMVSLIATYVNPSEKAALDQIVENIRFD
jgi:hypothetical protein